MCSAGRPNDVNVWNIGSSFSPFVQLQCRFADQRIQSNGAFAPRHHHNTFRFCFPVTRLCGHYYRHWTGKQQGHSAQIIFAGHILRIGRRQPRLEFLPVISTHSRLDLVEDGLRMAAKLSLGRTGDVLVWCLGEARTQRVSVRLTWLNAGASGRRWVCTGTPSLCSCQATSCLLPALGAVVDASVFIFLDGGLAERSSGIENVSSRGNFGVRR